MPSALTTIEDYTTAIVPTYITLKGVDVYVAVSANKKGIKRFPCTLYHIILNILSRVYICGCVVCVCVWAHLSDVLYALSLAGLRSVVIFLQFFYYLLLLLLLFWLVAKSIGYKPGIRINWSPGHRILSGPLFNFNFKKLYHYISFLWLYIIL